MNELLKNAAIALREQKQAEGWIGLPSWEKFVPSALVVIAAIRTPTSEMLAAGNEASHGAAWLDNASEDGRQLRLELSLREYQAIIDAVMNVD